MTEIGYLAFSEIHFKTKIVNGCAKEIMLNTPVYYFSLAVKNLFMISVILILVWKIRSLKAITCGLMTWDIRELYQEFCYLAGYNEDVLNIEVGLIGQVLIVCVVIIAVYVLDYFKSPYKRG
jgi:hypothetical protein